MYVLFRVQIPDDDDAMMDRMKGLLNLHVD